MEQTATTPGKDFFDTGVALVTDKPVAGVDQLTQKKEQISAGLI